jgi:hypothetical protein
MQRFPHNAGAHRVAPGRRGRIEMIALDSLGLAACDLLVLDVEGLEGSALTGARETLERCRPVIMVEERGHGGRYGWHRGTVEAHLVAQGYRVAHRLAHDLIMVTG